MSTPKNNLKNVKHIVLVLSGKGGVGKSSVTCQLGVALSKQNKKVAILDVDLCGPSIPRLLGIEDKTVVQSSNGWLPIPVDETGNLSCMSIGFLLPNKTSSVVWRGPKKNAMIKQFLNDVYWGEIDYLIIDTPPGTSDEHLALVEFLKEYEPDGAVLKVSLIDVKKELNFCRKTNIPILGIIENMSGFVCPHCAECSNLFSSNGGKQLAEEYAIPFLGRIPIDPQITTLFEQSYSNQNVNDESKLFINQYPKSSLYNYLKLIIDNINIKDK
ncbi:P-loop containing nucleoside triphosphate hydrolase protein [Neoconidiobolus thromboides FSU 785]|nr:P-loop containing nucleoside triphosphate hydrolase protein [Neoconidiobolus thromboides FSU 785]